MRARRSARRVRTIPQQSANHEDVPVTQLHRAKGDALAADLAQLAGPDERPQVEGQKAVEPISLLIIGAGVYVVGRIAIKNKSTWDYGWT